MQFSELKVLDFCWVGAGAFVTRILAELGACVIKIESHSHPDNLRLSGPHKPGARKLESSGYFASRNTSKKSFALNMTHPSAAAIARQRMKSVVERIIQFPLDQPAADPQPAGPIVQLWSKRAEAELVEAVKDVLAWAYGEVVKAASRSDARARTAGAGCCMRPTRRVARSVARCGSGSPNNRGCASSATPECTS